MKLPILCYHKVGSEAVEGRRLNVSPERLTSHVRFFARQGYTFVRGGDLASEWPHRGVCFTFDDAYVSTLENAPSIFERYRGVATFYAVSQLIGQTSSWDGEEARPLATVDQLLSAQEVGHEIGNHSASHARLAKLSDEEQMREIRQCDEDLKAHGLAPASFCFPYGSVGQNSKSVLQEAGYKVGLGLGKRVANDLDSRFCLPRIVLAYSDGLPMLMYKMWVRPLLP